MSGTTQAKNDSIEYTHDEIGFNYRLTGVQAALGCAQMENLDDYISDKRQLATNYTKALQKFTGISPMKEAPWAHSNFWLYTILINEEICGISSRKLLKKLGEVGIETRPLYQPLPNSSVYAYLKLNECKVAEKLNEEALSIPSSVDLSEENQSNVINKIQEFIA